MAQIQLKIGQLTSTKTVVDADATKVFNLIFDANAPKFNMGVDPPTPITYTAQQQLDFVLNVIITRMIADAKQQAAKVRRLANEAATNTESETIIL